MNTILSYFLWLLASIALQVLIFNQLSLFGGIALVYMIVLLKMPVEVNRVLQIFIGFLVGFVIDVFCNTPGMHSLATVTVMFLREPILHLYIQKEEIKNSRVCMSRLGVSSFVRYALTILLVHALLLYFIEAFTLFNFLVLLSKIIISVVLSLAFCLAFEFATLKK